MKRFVWTVSGLATLCICTQVNAAGPSEENIRSAYKMLLEQVDTNKDGIISMAECMSIYKDPSMAEKNCMFWDADKDGLIKEDEYVSRVRSIGNKHNPR